MDIIQKSISYLKSITAETISNAKSGHTGSALGASSILFALFHDHLKFEAVNSNWLSRDRFVLSAGHTSALLYSLLHMFGFNVSIEDLKEFRKYGSKTPGHPEFGVVPGVETTTGPLGQGVANAVGMAIAEERMHALFPNLVSNYTYCYAGDGCLMEGVANEAISLAGTLKLNKLILLYDDNNITIDGERTLANNEDVASKFNSMGWNVILAKNGNDYLCCTKAIQKAKSSKKPTIIIFKTTIGIGTEKQGTASLHASPLSSGELAKFKSKLGVNESFFIPDDVREFCMESTRRNNQIICDWNNLHGSELKSINKLFTIHQADFDRCLKTLSKNTELAGRDASSIVLNELSKHIQFFGGTADVGPSTKAVINDAGYFSGQSQNEKSNQNIHFGIREHAMGSIANGIALYFPNLNAFDSTFVAFSNYMMPSLRMRAMMNIPVLSIMTHDSIDIGEDGPTHQPIEQIPQMRSIIGLDVIRPGTYAEIVAGFKNFLINRKPTVLAITKSKIKNFENSTIEDAEKGGYVIFETKTKPVVEIFASGREVELAIEVAKQLENVGARVISMPCEKIFNNQPNQFKSKVLLKSPALKVAIEATNDPVWYKYVGETGLLINIESYQSSGNGKEVYEKAGFTKENILKQINKRLK